ncbi:MAG TPA: HAMP domain-containing sensor histidine kinase [Methylomusa anaerophila]|uniref:histidine kinase n=1 Tax=Methylomusa anaerophila TaxID=1930071 RepID=A0A348ANA9_9FIRM|nr:HAMP domain-containing sensor histidine kinase [Methylomusa anaerophila]BBB92557.1 signal transduction histidine-protein kinase ArlS [Methylomusa anaerophila]HML87588.1 HAMP domain-containing sensor histidine kinase [Methylomusa anaerophila]
MWSKIKLAIPVSVKLTILYAAILSCILLLTSTLTVAGLYYMLYKQANSDISASMNSVNHYWAAGKPLDQNMLEANLLAPGVILKVLDQQNRLLIDSAPHAAGNRVLLEELDEDYCFTKFVPLKSPYLTIVRINRNYFFFTNQVVVQQSGESYQLYFLKPIAEEVHFIKNLIKSLLVTNALGLFVAVVSGIYISRKILRPIRNITETAKEIEINQLGKRFEVTDSNDELQELARTFNHMLSRIQTGFEQQRRFVADASHELRTPITVISGYVDILDRWGKQDPAALQEGISAIKSEAANMYRLIEKLLFLARADQSKQVINKVTVAMEPLITDIVQETRLIAPGHRIELPQNDPAAIYADLTSIKEMLRIFIENSIKYTPEGGTISVISQKADHYLDITIKDTGIGIPEEDQPKIFDRFYRVDKSRSKATGGTGLGLSIARWIAEQHSSSIQLTSKPGVGTTVTVKIPLIKQLG